MEQSYWSRFTQFVKDSYTQRLKQSSGGLFMGLITANNLLFAGVLANLVGPLWWIFKGICTVFLAFFTSLATSYAAYLIEKHKENQKKSPTTKRKNKAA